MGRRRPTWPELPGLVRSQIEDRLGEPVVSWTSHDSGYSPGPALTLVTAHDRVFVKAADLVAHPVAGALHRREAEVAGVLPAGLPTPALRWHLDDGAWIILAFDAVEGGAPRVPWVDTEVRAVARLIDIVAGVEAPHLQALGERASFDGWRTLAGGGPSGLDSYDPWALEHLETLARIEETWRDAVTGDTLVHNDIRGDNVLMRDGEALAIDWPYAAKGAAFCDLVGWLPSLHMEHGPEPEEMLASTSVGRAADPDAVTSFAVAIAGYFVHQSLLPDPPGIPHVRAFQRAQGEVCLSWLRVRLRG